jgi:tellurite resistance protein
MKIQTATIVRLRDALLQSGRRPSVVLSSAYETLAAHGLLSPEESTAIDRVDLLGETMYLMMTADERVADAELDALRGAIRGLTDNLLRSGTINVMLQTYATRLGEQGRDTRLREIAEALSEHPREAEGAFTLAAAMALADDAVHNSENQLINQLAQWLGISAQRVDALLNELEHDQDYGG